MQLTTGSPTKDWLLFLMLPMSSKDGHSDKTFRGFCGPFQQWDSWKRCNLAFEDGIRPGSDCQSNTPSLPSHLSRGWPAGLQPLCSQPHVSSRELFNPWSLLWQANIFLIFKGGTKLIPGPILLLLQIFLFYWHERR